MIGGPGWCLTPEETRIYLELKARRPDGWEQEPWFAEDLAQAILAEQTKAERIEREKALNRSRDRGNSERYFSRYRDETEAQRKAREEKQRIHNAHIKQLDRRRIGLHKLAKAEFDAAGGRTNWLIAQRDAGRTLNSIGNQIGLTGWRVREIIRKEERIRAWRAKNPKPPPRQAGPEIPAALLAYPVDQLELGVRAANCLKNENIVTIGELLGYTPAELLRVPNFGKRSLNEIQDLLSRLGLWLTPNPRNPPGRPPPPEWLRE